MNLCLPANRLSPSRFRSFRRWLWLGLVWLVVYCGSGGRLVAETPGSLEYEVKSAFLVKFGMFVEWPTNTLNGLKRDVFLIGILGDDPFGGRFDEAVKKENVRGRAVQLKRAKNPAELAECQIVFIGASESNRIPELIGALADKGILSVADEPGFASRGGMIGFIKEAGKIRFEINPGAAERAGLKLSSKLLQVGKRVSETGAAQG